jgi:hypothetical protein
MATPGRKGRSWFKPDDYRETYAALSNSHWRLRPLETDFALGGLPLQCPQRARVLACAHRQIVMIHEQSGMSSHGRPRFLGMSERQSVILVLAVLGAAAALLIVPGVFTVDEANHLAWLVSLRSGRLTLPGTDALPGSSELLFFDPVPDVRPGARASSVVPPLYGLFALPFSLAGWTGLFLLNLTAWLVTIGLVRAAARRAGASQPAAWIGALAFALAGFSLEYAVGVWPHALAACLSLSAFVAALHAAERDRVRWAYAAGLLAGVAAGVRYQHIVTAGLIGLALLTDPMRRIRKAIAYAAGVALPLALYAVVNSLRAGILNPVSKGRGYVTLSGLAPSASPWDPLRSFAAYVLDFSMQRHTPLWEQMGGRWSNTGALMVLSAVKKALLQSAPWVLMVMVAIGAAWLRGQPASPARRVLRSAGIVMAGVLLLFAFAGTNRQDGWCHNPRYLFDLIPLAALALALLVERTGMRWRPLAVGAAAGGLGALVPLTFSPDSAVRQFALMYVPLLLAVASVVLFVVARGRPRVHRWLAPAMGVLLGWASAVHLGDDLPAARALRLTNLNKLSSVAALLPDVPVALIAQRAVALGPLLLERDVVIASTWPDHGRDAPALVEAFQRAGRRVFVLPDVPKDELAAISAGRLVRPVGGADSLFVEIGPRRPTTPAAQAPQP